MSKNEKCAHCDIHNKEVKGNDKNKKLELRLSIIRGQVDGVLEMVRRGDYCIDIITQTSAIKQGLTNVEDLLMETHLSNCAIKQIKEGKTAKAVEEILKVYKLKRK